MFRPTRRIYLTNDWKLCCNLRNTEPGTRFNIRKGLSYVYDMLLRQFWRSFYHPLWGESTVHRWILLTKASDAKLWCFLWSVPPQTLEQTIETPVIWDTITLIITSLTHNPPTQRCYVATVLPTNFAHILNALNLMDLIHWPLEDLNYMLNQ